MDIQNHYYSHSAVLAHWCGLQRMRHIAGLLQHGWTSTSPLVVHFGDFPTVGRSPHRRLLVWSHASRGWSAADADRPTTAVGSPWAYLDALTVDSAPPDRDGVVAFPFHGTRLMRVSGDHARLAHEVAEREGQVTVCLHHEDLTDDTVVTAWRSAGHELVTAGRRDDPAFLLRLMKALRGARRVVSNRLSTSVMYAAAVGAEVGVYGDPLTLTGIESGGVSRIEGLWPELHGAKTDMSTAGALARRELGYDHVLPPRQLGAVLGWETRWSVGPTADYWAGAPLGKALRVLGVAERARGTEAMPETGFSPLSWLRHPMEHLPRPLARGTPAVTQLPDLLRPGDDRLNA